VVPWQEIVDNLSDALVALSVNRDPIAVNPAAETMLGTSSPGRPVIEGLIRSNQWLGRMVDICLESGQILGDPEAILTAGGHEITVRAAVSPLLNDQGRCEGAIILLHDLAPEKSAEQTLGSGAGERLSPAGLAHEVKNPLTGIKGAAELLAAMFPGDARAQQYCGLILEGVTRITALVEQVLAMSGPARLRREPVNIHELLHHALAMAGLYPQAPDGIVVQQLFDPSLPEVNGDAQALERAFLNLIRNAVEAIGPAPGAAQSSAPAEKALGTIRLITRMETQFRLASAGRKHQLLRIEIRDSGKGMSEEEMGQLFTPFFTTKPAGNGLGLVLSQRIIALHGGKLWAMRGGVNEQPPSAKTESDYGHPPKPAGRASKKAGEAAARNDDEERGEVRGMTFCLTLPIGDTPGAGG
jgi:two-component system, NtrC family, nitrogen regulation sensor histidine kinase GlnL